MLDKTWYMGLIAATFKLCKTLSILVLCETYRLKHSYILHNQCYNILNALEYYIIRMNHELCKKRINVLSFKTNKKSC